MNSPGTVHFLHGAVPSPQKIPESRLHRRRVILVTGFVVQTDGDHIRLSAETRNQMILIGSAHCPVIRMNDGSTQKPVSRHSALLIRTGPLRMFVQQKGRRIRGDQHIDPDPVKSEPPQRRQGATAVMRRIECSVRKHQLCRPDRIGHQIAPEPGEFRRIVPELQPMNPK